MCLLNSTNPDIALTVSNIAESLQELAMNPDGPYAFAHEATLATDQGMKTGTLPVLVRAWTRERAQREAAIEVRQAFIDAGEELLPPIASVPVCPTCRNRREVLVAVDEWGEEITGPCPACVRDDHDLRQFA